MRTTRMELVNGRDRIPLVVRARFEKTFFGLGAFAGVVLLLGGGYLMTEALEGWSWQSMSMLPAKRQRRNHRC